MKVNSGNYYGRDADGKLHRIGDVDAPPDIVICRRVADYPAGTRDGQVGRCSQCAAPIRYNPDGPHQDRPRVCMQCAGIQPLPIEPAS